ncbi:Potassium transporter 6 [Platanthera guangdongensis]|uniref:Potassium transporter n=1 Tax=Platanthera guangdongensis TaxID=2320717 RepID=A0ABR2M8F0_9ASPA
MSSPAHISSQQEEKNQWKQTLILSFQSLGIVFGQLSIGPLIVSTTVSANSIKSEEMLFGHLSFIFWTMTLIPLAMYVFIVLKADDNGEGGTFALYSLLCRCAQVGLLPYEQLADDALSEYEIESSHQNGIGNNEKMGFKNKKKRRYLMLFMALMGSSMIVSNGVLVPALSVFSASIGLDQSLTGAIFETSEEKENFNSDVVVPTACAIVVALFLLQHYGTGKVGFLFAPIIILWLLFIGVVGLYNTLRINPRVVVALSPQYLYKFMKNFNIRNWKALGSILLSIAGSEEMFANIGHSSKKAIKATFIFFVYPSLILCYMGQTAYLSKAIRNSDINYVTHLRASMPKHFHHYFVWLSLLASVVGSQATITATFSIVNQCIALGCFPKVPVVHTSDRIRGQVYIPSINFILMIFCLFFIILIKNVHHLGNATGLATITGMIITTCFMSLMIAKQWNKPVAAACFIIFFGIIEAMYFAACALNYLDGAWMLVALAFFILITMLSWHYGTVKMYAANAENKVSIEYLVELSNGLGLTRVPGIGIVCVDIMRGIPPFFVHFITNLPAIHQVLIFVSFKSMPAAHVPPSRQCLIGRLGPKQYRMFRCILRHGYGDSVLDINEFEDRILDGIFELVSQEVDEISEPFSPESRMIVASDLHDNNSIVSFASVESIECGRLRKKVRFSLPPKSPDMSSPVREELQGLIDAREHGTTYICSQPHLSSGVGSSWIRKFLFGIYVFLQKNLNQKSVVLNIPNAAYVEVAMNYSI